MDKLMKEQTGQLEGSPTICLDGLTEVENSKTFKRAGYAVYRGWRVNSEDASRNVTDVYKLEFCRTTRFKGLGGEIF